MTTDIKLEQYDEYIKSIDWLADADMPVAITLEEVLEPAEGSGAVIFPPTFAVSKTATHPYQIDLLNKDLTPQEAAKSGLEANICQIDGVGSQANRAETKFKESPLAALVPQVTVKLNDDTKANLLDIGHRIADGAVRFSGLRDDVTTAIKALRDQANAAPLAKLAPTSLVFGFWDSRPDTTMYKFGRMLSSTIRATNVEIVKRSAQYNPTFDPTLLGLAEDVPDGETEPQETSGKAADGKDPLSKLGLRAAPAVNTHGGVRVYGQIVRRTQINLVRLRALAVTNEGKLDEEETLKLRRYLLGLALIAARAQTDYNLREGCLLRCQKAQAQLVYTNSDSQPFALEIKTALAYAEQAAAAFGVGERKDVTFDAKTAKQGVEEAKKAAKEKAGKKK
ncbi:MAG: type I-U CRISPR-associated RAMP protein Csb1/Cas7u [Blastocatellia bacterium]